MDGPLMRRIAVAVQVIAATAIALSVVALVLDVIAGDIASVISTPFFLAFPVVASIVGRRRPSNVVVWCFLITALFIAFEQISQNVGTLGQSRHWNSTLTHVAAWTDAWSWFPGLFVVVTVGLLRFPDGRLLTPRWRWLERTSVSVIGIFVLAVAISTWEISTRDLLSDNEPSAPGWRGVVFKIGGSMIPVVLLCVLGSLASLVVRYRRSGLVERQQTRWVLFSASVAIAIEIVLDVVGTTALHVPDWVQTLGEGLGFALIAISTGIAISRYKLFEIDRIVSRTVSYALVTALLAGTYVGIVALATAAVPARYGSVGVAAATLVVAALFVPVRRRTQALVDRRFDRAAYDAQLVIEAFAVHVRGELSGQSLDAELLRTVAAAVSPSTVSIWLVPVSN